MKRFFAGLALAATLIAAPQAQAAYAKNVCLTTAGTFTVTLATLIPDWNPADNRILIWGGAGNGAANASSASGGGAGGGGGFNSATIVSFSSTFTYVVGAQGANSWICSGTSSCTGFNTGGVIASARSGSSPVAGSGSGASGASTTSTVGTTPQAGGVGGTGGGTKGSGGGGSAGGPSGASANGSNGTATNIFGAGATADNGTGGAGGATVSAAGGAGSEIGTCTGGDTASGTIGPGGGGAGGDNVSANGGNGGYAAGGAGGYFGGTAGTGGQGLIIIQYNPVGTATAHLLNLLGVGR